MTMISPTLQDHYLGILSMWLKFNTTQLLLKKSLLLLGTIASKIKRPSLGVWLISTEIKVLVLHPWPPRSSLVLPISSLWAVSIWWLYNKSFVTCNKLFSCQTTSHCLTHLNVRYLLLGNLSFQFSADPVSPHSFSVCNFLTPLWALLQSSIHFPTWSFLHALNAKLCLHCTRDSLSGIDRYDLWNDQWISGITEIRKDQIASPTLICIM